MVKKTDVGDVLQRLGPVKLRVEVTKLSRRVAELEEEVRECRRHQHRVAELTDLVEQLLLPMARQDREAVDELLARYTEQLG